MSDDGTWTDDGPGSRAPTAVGERYRDEGRIAVGGMSEVRRVFDLELGFHAAMKVLRPELLDNARAVSRFLREGALTARLQHPGIVAVYSRGELADGRPWFTMTEVRGDTFDAVVKRVHTAGEPSDEELRRGVGLLLRACEAVGYAHSQGIVHRDLKPANIMVGAFSEVMVLDWGVARVLDEHEPTDVSGFLPSDDGATRSGDVLGTPRYMPPEQARGDHEALGPGADVYALGAVLYELITGRTADTGPAREVWRRLLSGPPALFVDVQHPVPTELESICRRAMDGAAERRYPDAAALGDAVREWLDGARRKARALGLLEDAAALRPEIDRLRRSAANDRRGAQTILAPLAPYAPAETKARAWALEDAARDAEQRAEVLEVQWRQVVGTALEQVPELPEAHAVLADHYAERLLDAENRGASSEVARAEALLGLHDRGAHAALLSGSGTVSLRTEPPGAEVRLFRYVDADRRRVAQPHGTLGTTPLKGVRLERGSWLLELHLEGHEVVRYPVFLGRADAHEGVRPGDTEAFAVRLPPVGEIGPDQCYVPGGPFIAGGDPLAADALPRQRVWVDAFTIARSPVTCAAFAAFLDVVADREGLEAALRLAPELVSEDVPLLVHEAGAFRLHPSRADQGDWPVVGIPWMAARAYAAWAGARLPTELEWEKAARGADGRFCSWGDLVEPTWANVLGHSAAPPSRSAVGRFASDESPFGCLGMVGNVRDWCGNAWRRSGPRIERGLLLEQAAETGDLPDYVPNRGGSWTSVVALSRAAIRFADPPTSRHSNIGFRLVW